MDNYSDEDLVSMSKGGDPRAFEELFHRYKLRLLNFIYHMIGNKETAEEVCQDAFIKAYKNLELFDTDKKFSTWLYVIAKNLAKNSLRDKKYFRDVSMDKELASDEESITLKDFLKDDHLRPDHMAQYNDLNEQVQDVLNSLPPEYTEVITLCSIQGLSCKETAEILGCSIATISIRLDKAKRLFMKKLGIEDA